MCNKGILSVVNNYLNYHVPLDHLCQNGIEGITFKNSMRGTKERMVSRQRFASRRWLSKAPRVLHVKSYKRRSP